MKSVKMNGGGGGDAGFSELSEDERRALRGSKFAPLPISDHPSSSYRPQARLAHPGGPLATNKAAALAKFLERKLQQPGGLDSIDPDILELAVKNAKETVKASGTSNSGRIVRHVASFDDDSSEEFEKQEMQETKKWKKKKKVKEQQEFEKQDMQETKKRKKKKKVAKSSKASKERKHKKTKL